MLNQYSRAELVFGPEPMNIIAHSRVAVFGIGGVGGNVVEALARSGIGTLDLIDDDRICLTNLNRQILATRSTVGQYKVDAAAARVHDIDPRIQVNTWKTFFLPGETDQLFDFTRYDYVVDAIDTVTGKINIVLRAQEAGVPVISVMGCGNRVDPTKLVCCDLYETSQDPLARVMRYELRKRHVKKLKVVYSTEPAIRPLDDDDNSCLHHCICPPGTKRKCTDRRDIPGSTAFVPPVAGIIVASEIVRDLTHFDPRDRWKGGKVYEAQKEKDKARQARLERQQAEILKKADPELMKAMALAKATEERHPDASE